MKCTRLFSDASFCTNEAIKRSVDFGFICRECFEELLDSYDHDIVNFMSGNEPEKPWTKMKLVGIFKEIKK